MHSWQYKGHHNSNTIMKSAIQAVSVILLHFIIFAASGATAIAMQKGNKIGFARALSDDTIACDTKSAKLGECISMETIDCALCPMNAITSARISKIVRTSNARNVATTN